MMLDRPRGRWYRLEKLGASKGGIMNGKLHFSSILAAAFFASVVMAAAQTEKKGPVAPALSPETAACVECHSLFSPGIVEDWKRSRHALVTPKEALGKQAVARRMSAETVAPGLQSVAVGCYECHGLNPSVQRDTFEHFGTKINTVVSPKDCATCHPIEAEQYSRSKKAFALPNLEKNPVYAMLVGTVTNGRVFKSGVLTGIGSSSNAKNETCYACHGTEVKAKGMKKVATALGDIEIPELTNMPNQGVGRINPDGSQGSCSACHARHAFSIEVARKPYTCAQCHVEPDVPAWNVYKESKHGNIFLSGQKGWNFDAVPWAVGKDFAAPTCASCHVSLVTTPDGDVVRQRSHDFGDRLWVRIFGLVYSHPQPKAGSTWIIRNKDKLPLPTAFDGEPAREFLIDGKEQQERQAAMAKFCASCHGSTWVGGHFDKFRTTLKEADAMVLASTELMREAWNRKAADNSNPFDEKLEQQWVTQWLINANSLRYTSAMGGPDHAAFKNGWWGLTKTLEEMREHLKIEKGK
jgi:mono/diheme cytochrome c family protein